MKCLYQIADHNVHRFVMPVINSNMYVLTSKTSALIIDPHVDYEAELLLKKEGINDCVVLLTHEHFDHISGVNRLRKLFSCHVICTEKCAQQIINPRKSGAAHFAELFLMHSSEEQEIIKHLADTEYQCEADETYCGEKDFQWEDLKVLLKEAPGHSKGSQIIYMNDKYIFTGDSFIPGEEVVLRLPGSNKIDYERKVKPLLHTFKESIIYPGHSNPIYLEEIAF